MTIDLNRGVESKIIDLLLEKSQVEFWGLCLQGSQHKRPTSFNPPRKSEHTYKSHKKKAISTSDKPFNHLYSTKLNIPQTITFACAFLQGMHSSSKVQILHYFLRSIEFLFHIEEKLCIIFLCQNGLQLLMILSIDLVVASICSMATKLQITMSNS